VEADTPRAPGLPERRLPSEVVGGMVDAANPKQQSNGVPDSLGRRSPACPHQGDGRRGGRMKSAFWPGVLAASLLTVGAHPAAAQDPPFDRIQLSTIVVKAGMTSTFEAQVKLLNEARAKAKDPTARSVWQVGRGGPARTFYSVIRFNKWAELEPIPMNVDVLAKAFGEREAVRLTEAMTESIESVDTEVFSVWKGMNSWKDGSWAYAWVADSHVRPAMTPQWEQQVAGRLAASKKAPNWPATIRYRSTLGPSSRYLAVRYFDKWSDVDAWPEIKDLVGTVEADKIDALTRAALETGRQFVIRRRPELSYIPTP
jgi:hypothetical protein